MPQVPGEAATRPPATNRHLAPAGQTAVRCGLILLAAVSLAGCSEPEINSGRQVAIEVLNSTALSSLTVTVEDGTVGDGTQSIVTFEPNGANPAQVSTGVEAAGELVRFHVEVEDEIVDHTCHVHADAVGNPDNVPRAVIHSEPLRVVCQSGWQEEETE
jgi:hypothetical protein